MIKLKSTNYFINKINLDIKELIMNQGYEVKTDVFEGPLDLLLHLINQLEIDIYDIPMTEITNQYMQFIQKMKNIQLDIASEYLVMAATLLAIKSDMLLPKKEIIHEDEYMEDPREELIERLIEYRKYKDIADKLKDKELEDNRVYTRAPIVFKEILNKPQMTKGNISIYEMVSALETVFLRHKWHEPLDTKIDRKEVSIEESMIHIKGYLNHHIKQVKFSELFLVPDKLYIVTTFLAMLELMKQNQIKCIQDEQFSDIYVSLLEEN